MITLKSVVFQSNLPLHVTEKITRYFIRYYVKVMR